MSRMLRVPRTCKEARGAGLKLLKPSEKPHERAKRLTIKRIIATYMNASPVSGTLS